MYVTMSGLVAAAADGNIEFMNESFAQLFLGYKHKDLTGKVLKSVQCLNSVHYIIGEGMVVVASVCLCLALKPSRPTL